MSLTSATSKMAGFALWFGCAVLWSMSLYPAARLSPALLLLLTPLAGMVCDAPQTPCLRILGSYYAILLAGPIELGVILLYVLSGFRASWKAALAFNVLNWGLYAVVLPLDWRP